MVALAQLTKVLIDGGAGLNVIFASMLKKMILNITDLMTLTDAPFYDIMPGKAMITLGQVTLPITFST